MAYINVNTLGHHGTRVVTNPADNRYVLENIYSSAEKLKDIDHLFREGDVAGAYIFYRILSVSHKRIAKSDRLYAAGHRWFSFAVRQRVTKRKEIKELRGVMEYKRGQPATLY